MKIALDNRKYKKRMFSLWLITIAFSFAFIMMIVINVKENKGFGIEKIIISMGLLLILSFFLYLLTFYLRLKKNKDCVIKFENGELNDYSKPFNRASLLKIDEIYSISFWRETNGINQFKIVTVNNWPNRNGLINQLSGNHFYFSDYVVDTDELITMMKLIQKECL